jgi:hypothetical protein
VREWLTTLLYDRALPQKAIIEKAGQDGITENQVIGAKDWLKKNGTVDVRKVEQPEPHWEWFLSGSKVDPRNELMDQVPPQGNGRG